MFDANEAASARRLGLSVCARAHTSSLSLCLSVGLSVPSSVAYFNSRPLFFFFCGTASTVLVASISLSLYCFGAVVAVRVVPRSRDLCLDGKSLTPFYAFLLSAVNVFLGG